MHCALVLTPLWSLVVRMYTPLSSSLYALISRVASFSPTLTKTFGLVPTHPMLLPTHVASVTLLGSGPVSGSRSQVSVEILSRGPCSMRALRTRSEPGMTCTGSLLMMCTDIHRSPHGAEDRLDRLLLHAHQNFSLPHLYFDSGDQRWPFWLWGGVLHCLGRRRS